MQWLGNELLASAGAQLLADSLGLGRAVRWQSLAKPGTARARERRAGPCNGEELDGYAEQRHRTVRDRLEPKRKGAVLICYGAAEESSDWPGAELCGLDPQRKGIDPLSDGVARNSMALIGNGEAER